MLHEETVSPATLELLKQLCAIPELSNFALVGGTNLALRFGHRISIDIDLFANEPFNKEKIRQVIHDTFPDSVLLDEMKQTLWYQVNGVKTDIVLHEYRYLQPVEEIAGIRLVSLPDIIPMKLGAVSGRGAMKDFWDIAELLKHFSIAEMIDFYRGKYVTDDIGLILKSLLYFEDAEIQNDPVSLNSFTWSQVKKDIDLAVKNYVSTSF